MLTEKTRLVPEGLPVRATGQQDGTNSNHGGNGSASSASTTAAAAAAAAAAPDAAAPGPTKGRLRKLHSAPIDSLLSTTRVDIDSLRLSYAAKLVLAAVEGRNVESAVDLLVLKGGFVNPLAHPIYRTVLVCVIMGHLVLALWEGGKSPFPLCLPVAAAEIFAFLFYTAYILLNLWTFGTKLYRDKKWHFIFTVVSTWHFLLLAFGALAARAGDLDGSTGGEGDGSDWQSASRLAMLGAHALRPVMLISNLQTIRRVFTNVLRTASRTGSILALGAVALAFYSVLGINLFNSEQVSGYTADGDNFDNFGAAVLSLFVLTTEENFPMVADPSFSGRPLVAFPFFVSFLLLFLIVILPLLLGIVLDAYAQQHAQQNTLCRNKARTALLAAFYVLDEDGHVGLTREQLVGVLTAEAGVGIDRGHAEQLWHALGPHRNEDQANARAYLRSHSVPLTNIDRLVIDAASSAAAAAGVNRSSSDNSPGRQPLLATPSSVGDTRADRFRANTLSLSAGIDRGRVDVHGFLQLADLLHQKVEESEEAGVKAGGCGGTEGCALAGCEGACFTLKIGVSAEVGRQVDCVWESADENGGLESGGEDSDSASDSNVSGSPENGGGDGERAAGSVCVGVAGTGGAGQRLRRYASCFLEVSRRAARKVVGRTWFTAMSQVIAVLLTVAALTWTPMSQQRYDLCLKGGEGEPDVATCRGQFALRRVEGVVLLAFLAEMTTKVLAVGCKRLWRLHWSHRFDAVILITSMASYLVIGIPGNTRVLYVDNHPGLSDLIELPRAMMVLRLVTVFPQLRQLLDTMTTVAGMLLKIMVLYSCVSYSFAAVGMAIFGDAKSTILEPRYSFSTLPEAALALFFLTVTNNWNDLLYPLVNTVRSGRWSAIYFAAYMLFCATMMLDVLVGVVIEGFRVSTKGPRQTPAASVHPEESESGEEESRSGKHSGDDEASLSDGSSLAGRGGSAPGTSRRRYATPRRGITRKTSQRKYIQVRAEDMFRTDPKGELDEQDVRELNEAVVAVEERLHQAWVNHFRRTVPAGDNV